MTEPRRGEVWWGEHEKEGRRPYLVMTRDSAIPLLPRILAVPLTRTSRGISSELALGPADGLLVECAASFDNTTLVVKAYLTEHLCTLDELRMADACAALRSATDC